MQITKYFVSTIKMRRFKEPLVISIFLLLIFWLPSAAVSIHVTHVDDKGLSVSSELNCQSPDEKDERKVALFNNKDHINGQHLRVIVAPVNC